MTLKRQILGSFAIGALFVAGWFLLCAEVASLPVISDVSLSLAFRPWWRLWPVTVALFLMPLLALSTFHIRRSLLSLRA